jgi:26S proteasome regulatory subunit N1
LPYDFKHNAEAEACDLLLEVDKLDWIKDYVNDDNHSRVCLYLLGFSSYVVDMEELGKILQVTYDIYKECKKLPDALRVAIKMDNVDHISEVFAIASEAEDDLIKKQLGFILGSQKLTLPEYLDDDTMMAIIGNFKVHEHYLHIAKDLEVLDPKSPEDIYKNHLADQSKLRRQAGGKVDSAKQNLASTFVNAFVNAGFSKDLLMSTDDSSWIYKNKDHGQLSAVASLGMIYLWDIESGFSTVDKFTYHNQEIIRAGALLATGLISSGVTSEMDAAFALLVEHIGSENELVKVSTIMGLAFAYAGSRRDDILETLLPYVSNPEEKMEVSSLAALALGFVFVGQYNDDVSGAILDALMTRSETDLNNSMSLFMALGLGLLYVGKGESTEAILEALQVVEHPIAKSVEMTVLILAYIGSGNVLQVEKLLSVVGEHIEGIEDNDVKGMHQAIAVIGLAAIALGESLGGQMTLRVFDSVIQYCEINVRRAVPLALGLLSVSNPNITVIDTLSKLSHDNDEFVSQNAVFSLGLIGAGTNNSRVAQLLRQLAVFYAKVPNHLFLVRIAQGLLYMGKGVLTLNPIHSDGLLLSKISICGLFTTIFSMLTSKNSRFIKHIISLANLFHIAILSDRHYLLYSIVTAMKPRFLITLDENLNPLPVSVRVGQAVDVVGQAGRPKTITGFQTQTTPVVLSYGQRAELATDEYIPLTNVLEGFVILKKNPDAVKESE